MSKTKNLWIKDVEKYLHERAMSSTEISFRLKERYRNTPHARKVTLGLKGHKDLFRSMNKVEGQGSFSNRIINDNYKVTLWGLRGINYEREYPYNKLA